MRKRFTFHTALAALALAGLLLASPAQIARAQAPNPNPAPTPVENANTGHDGATKDEHAGGEHKQPGLVDVNIPELIFTISIFLALLLILRFAAWKPILQGLKSRENAIREGIEAAQRARDEAARTAKVLEAKIAEAQRAGAQEVARAKVDAQKLADTIRVQAEAEANALKDRTLRDIDAAKQQAIADINTHAADLGTAIARKILQREVKVEDQKRLVEESLAQLGTSKII